MFSESSFSFNSLTSQDRHKLAQLLTKRGEYLTLSVKLNQLKVNALNNPSPEADEAVRDFSSTVVAPLRKAMTDDAMDIMRESINIEELKALLPMVVMGTLQSVNLPMMLSALGIEPDAIDEITKLIKTYIESDLQ